MAEAEKTQTQEWNYALAIHGGAGNFNKASLTSERMQLCRDKMKEALEHGHKMLAKGEKGVDVVEAVIKILEDSPLFNAGKGSVFTNKGENEMDAAIMDGQYLKTGSVTGVQTIKNPISAAKAIMEKSKFVFLSGTGAEQFAEESGLEIVPKVYFFTRERWDELVRVKEGLAKGETAAPDDAKLGTVGCVVLDSHGNLAAGTSTGGIVNKMYNRVGDSPLIGAGTYANNKTCAVSCTGHGEDFIRLVAAHEVSAIMQYRQRSLRKATQTVMKKRLDPIGGRGGLIAIDRLGTISMRFNTKAMYRGKVDKQGNIYVSIFRRELPGV